MEGQTSLCYIITNKGVEDRTLLWHKRIGHISDNRLQQLSKRGLLCGGEVIGIDLCKHYIACK